MRVYHKLRRRRSKRSAGHLGAVRARLDGGLREQELERRFCRLVCAVAAYRPHVHRQPARLERHPSLAPSAVHHVRPACRCMLAPAAAGCL